LPPVKVPSPLFLVVPSALGPARCPSVYLVSVVSGNPFSPFLGRLPPLRCRVDQVFCELFSPSDVSAWSLPCLLRRSEILSFYPAGSYTGEVPTSTLSRRSPPFFDGEVSWSLTSRGLSPQNPPFQHDFFLVDPGVVYPPGLLVTLDVLPHACPNQCGFLVHVFPPVPRRPLFTQSSPAPFLFSPAFPRP